MLALPAEQGVPVLDMRDELTVFQGLDNPNRWQDHSGDLRLGGRRLTAKRSCVHCGKLRLTRLYGLWEGSRPVVPGPPNGTRRLMAR